MLAPQYSLITDNAKCVEILREISPQLLDEMPVCASSPTSNGGSRVVYRTLYSPMKKHGCFVAYFGWGCDQSDNGWAIAMFDAETRDKLHCIAKSIAESLSQKIS